MRYNKGIKLKYQNKVTDLIKYTTCTSCKAYFHVHVNEIIQLLLIFKINPKWNFGQLCWINLILKPGIETILMSVAGKLGIYQFHPFDIDGIC